MKRNLTSPTMALNAEGAKPYFQMDNNYIVPSNHSLANMLDWIKTYTQQQGGKLNSLVIHCHSAGWTEGGIQIGDKSLFENWSYGYGLSIGTGITKNNTRLFETLSESISGSNIRKGIINDIYLTGCGAAQITEAKGDRPRGDGNMFCCAIAKAAGANVYASTDEQITWSLSDWRAKNIIEFNGIVLRYKPDGSNERVF